MKINIYKRKNSPFYQISFSIFGNNFRFSSQSKLKSHAESLAKKLFDEKYNEIALGNKKFNLLDVLNYYVDSNIMASLSKASSSQNKLTILELSNYFENKEFNTQNYYVFLNDLKARRKLADNSLKKYIQSTNGIINYALERGYITKNPLEKLNKSHLKDVSRLRYLSTIEWEVLESILKEGDNDLYDYVVFAMNSGLRLGEQLNLSLDRVDLKNSEIYITETKTKTNRTIPINPVLLDVLNKRKNIKGNVFSLPKGTLHSRWIIALQKANIKDFRWHDLRHTFASWCIKGWFVWQRQPYDLYKVSKLLGHADIKMTTKYAHLQIEDLKENIIN